MQRAEQLGRPVLLAASRAMRAPADLARFLASGEAPRVFFQAPAGEAIAGLGTACAIEAAGPGRFDEARLRAEALVRHAVVVAEEGAPGLRFVGGFAFADDHDAEGPWSGLPAARFVVPGVALVQRGDAAWVTVARLVEGREDPEALARHLGALAARAEEHPEAPVKDAPGIPLPAFGQRVLEREEWTRGVHAALEAIGRGALRKVVLARRVPVPLTAPLGGHVALARLAARYPDCFLYVIEPGPGRTFLGASPELLVASDGKAVASMALAGSAPRGPTAEEDDALGRGLRDSPKERREHAVVQEDMAARLRGAGVALDPPPDEPQLLRLRNVQHLHTPLRGTLQDGAHVLDLVGALHPSPAVGGAPRAPALRFLRATEGFSRGWYAGPIGWFDAAGQGVFAVALRCALLARDEAWLFAGAGIVEDSDPVREWEETILKLQPMLEALGGKP